MAVLSKGRRRRASFLFLRSVHSWNGSTSSVLTIGSLPVLGQWIAQMATRPGCESWNWLSSIYSVRRVSALAACHRRLVRQRSTTIMPCIVLCNVRVSVCLAKEAKTDRRPIAAGLNCLGPEAFDAICVVWVRNCACVYHHGWRCMLCPEARDVKRGIPLANSAYCR